MFCDNVSYQTDRQQNCGNYCAPKNLKKQVQSFQYIPTEQTQRNPSNVYNHNFSGRSYPHEQQPRRNVDHIKVMDTMELVEQNTRRDYKKLQAVERNKNLSAILSIVLAFTQRCQTLKQKLCGYPAQSFCPVDFFNILDITQKGYVDLYDVKRFVNNEKIREKDIIALFKRVNGDHSKDNTKLSYFGYLNLIKPYFNEQLARDLLLRDTLSKKGKYSKRVSNPGSKITGQMIEITQESVLLLFQQLILLHCICTTEHEQAKQLLMNEYMLNTIEIKQILGLNNLNPQNKNLQLSPSRDSSSRVKHKTTLSVMFDFIQNNSQFEIEFKQMKLLLSFLNCHQFSLLNDKYISLLFLPTNCKTELMKELNKKKNEIQHFQDTQNYMNTYLTKENLMNRGNIQMIKNYLDQKAQYSLNGNHHKVMGSSSGAASKANFLQFVHPRSLQRVNQPYQDSNQINQQVSPQQLPSPHLGSQHPQFQINASNKYLSNNLSGGYNPLGSGNERQISNSSSIPQQNIKVIPPRESFPRQDQDMSQRQPQYRSLPKQKYQNPSRYGYQNQQGLKHEFYQNDRQKEINVNTSKISNASKTPFLEQFMKKDNVLKNYQKQQNPNDFKRKIINQQNSRVESSGFSDSAFQVVDYGYEQSRINHYNSNQRNQASKKYADESQKIKKQTLDSRYNLVVSQYKGKNVQANQSSGPKFERSMNRNQIGYKNQILENSKGNVIESVGLSQSNVVNQSNLLNKFSVGGGGGGGNNILNQFFKKS